MPSLGDEEWQALRGPIESGWLTQGSAVAAFEQAFARRHRVGHALATTSCTTALHLALVAMGVGPGDEVVVPAFTWVATANVVRHTGAAVVFCDVERDTFNMDPTSLRQSLSSRTRVVIPVHLFGLCADMDAIRSVLPTGVRVLEDAACAVGASYRGTPAGALGDAGAFSFHPRKVITTGEGGMLTTDDSVLAETARRLRNHGASISEEERHHGPRPHVLAEHDVVGFNYRMTDLQGAMGLVQLGKLDAFVTERAKAAQFYREELASLAWLRTPVDPGDGGHAWQAFVCYVEDDAPITRNDLMERLDGEGVSTRPGTHAVHMVGAYRHQHAPDDFPSARDADRRSMALPLHNRMTESDYRHVVHSLRRVVA